MPRKLDVQDLLAFQLPGSVCMSPAGDRIAFVVSRVDKEKNETQTSIYMVAPGGKPVRFTGGDSDSAPRFSPDGSQLAFLSRRSGQAQVWVMSLSGGGEARQVTRVQGGVGEFDWAPDGTRLAFTAHLKADGIQPEVKEEKEDDLLKKHTKDVKTITELTHKLDGVGWYTERRDCLCLVGLEEGAQPVQLTFPPYSVSEINFTPDGRQILFTSRMGEDYDALAWETNIYSIAVDGGEARQLTPKELTCEGGSRVSPDGTTVALIAADPVDMGYGNGRLYLMPLDGGPLTRIA
ncbi:MAG TPA: LpqB family beta-propeller domain-containing protein, partial [Symbiobacteriaceae bacterium]|nr:LpqB family beta-propeller domain-containing protein [Symbiobacteriaceae bacterium]